MRIHAWALLLSSVALCACTPANPCAAANGGCSAEATCSAQGEVATCACKAGFSGDGRTCTDVDECATAHGGCAPDATCTNTPGGRTCSCKPGYAGDGVSCPDVDECATSNGGCAPDASCTNTAGGHACACKAGYAGDGVTCDDVDECATSNGGCSPEATCSNTPGGRTCTCKAGYAGNGVTCADVNECLSSPCDASSTCANTPGSFRCDCAQGFTPDGGTCEDVDECLFVKCTANAACVNQPGGYECRCNAGYGNADGGACMAVAEVVATGLPAYADGLALDSAHGRLFATLDNGSVVGVPLDGGAAFTVAPPQGSSPALHDIATDGVNVFWADPLYGDPYDGGVFYAPADGTGTPARFASAFTPFGLYADGTTLFWSQQDGALFSATLPTGPNQVAVSTQVMDGNGFGNAQGLQACGLALVGADLYFLDFWGGKVGAIPTAGGLATQLASGLETMWGRSITSGSANGHAYVYWTVPGFNARELWGFEVPAASGVSPTPVKLLSDPGLAPTTFDAVAADDAHVYWISNGQLLRLPVDAATLSPVPTPEVVYAGGAFFDSLTSLALDDTHAYVATSSGREVLRLVK